MLALHAIPSVILPSGIKQWMDQLSLWFVVINQTNVDNPKSYDWWLRRFVGGKPSLLGILDISLNRGWSLVKNSQWVKYVEYVSPNKAVATSSKRGHKLFVAAVEWNVFSENSCVIVNRWGWVVCKGRNEGWMSRKRQPVESTEWTLCTVHKPKMLNCGWLCTT